MNTKSSDFFEVAFCHEEHKSPVAKVYRRIPIQRLDFVLKSLMSPANHCEILYVEQADQSH
jgi:hypothetical protein